ncbi:MAG: RIP metalloprotease RseP [Proteobacteria bacterium]|nr:RIP metalloprotease RseP [Pseudomonadota bacterium]
MSFLISAAAFIVVLTILVFVHELGHYAVARWRGIRVETFSVGFGPEITGWTDRAGTRWKVSWVPFGGYVKFFGDVGVASGQAEEREFTAAERAVSFHHKPVWSRAAVVVAGPLANFVFAVVALAALYATVGQEFSPPVLSAVEPGTAAAAAGFEAEDRLLEIDGYRVDRFEDLMLLVFANPGRELEVLVDRGGLEMVLFVTPGIRTVTDRSGNEREIGYLGVRGGTREVVRHSPPAAFWYATKQTGFITEQTLIAVGRMITGSAPTDDVRGPIGIAQLSGEVARFGLSSMVEFMALLSISLGLINLFPVPMLDGGHLLYYGIEVLRGRPLGPRAQEIGFRFGLALVLSLMVFATWNDVVQLHLVERLRGLF